MHLSRHFINNWIDRVGFQPTETAIVDIIRESVRVQKGQKLLKIDGSPFNTLTIYWHPDLKLILLVDRYSNTAVSVLSRENGTASDHRPVSPFYTPMTMHGK
jgi:hypothetical protein